MPLAHLRQLATSSPGAAPEGSHNGTRTPIQVTALEATRTAFGLLQSMTGVLPGPANVVVALGQHIVTIIDVRPYLAQSRRLEITNLALTGHQNQSRALRDHPRSHVAPRLGRYHETATG